MQIKETTQQLTVPVQETYLESPLQEQNSMLWNDPHSGSSHQFILVSYHICIDALLYWKLLRLFADHLSQNITWIIYLKVKMWILQYIIGCDGSYSISLKLIIQCFLEENIIILEGSTQKCIPDRAHLDSLRMLHCLTQLTGLPIPNLWFQI